MADVPSIKKTGAIWVAPEEEAVVTRFLFAFPNGLGTAPPAAAAAAARDPSFGTNSLAADFEREVRECIEKLAADSASGGTTELDGAP